MQITEALKNLYMKITGKETPPEQDQIAELINQIAEEWPAAAKTEEGQQ